MLCTLPFSTALHKDTNNETELQYQEQSCRSKSRGRSRRRVYSKPPHRLERNCDRQRSRSAVAKRKSHLNENDSHIPLPFSIPRLDRKQRVSLYSGEMIELVKTKNNDSKFVAVVDVKAPVKLVWKCLLDFDSYPEVISKVKEITFENTRRKFGEPSVTRTEMLLSRHKYKASILHKYTPHPLGDFMTFTLDKDCSSGMAIVKAEGNWYTQVNPQEKGKNYTRIWMLCDIESSKFVPNWIVENTIKKFLPSATSWIKPRVESLAAKNTLKRKSIRRKSVGLQ